MPRLYLGCTSVVPPLLFFKADFSLRLISPDHYKTDQGAKAMKKENLSNTDDRIAEIEILKRRPLLSKKEFKILSGLSEPTITRLILSGKIPAKRIGRSVRILNDGSEIGQVVQAS